MNEYDTDKFKATLDFLTMRTCFGTFNELPVVKSHQELMSTINGGKAVRLYRYYKPTNRSIANTEHRRMCLSAALEESLVPERTHS